MLKTILPKPSAKELVIFSDTSISYGDTEIRYDDAVGLSFHSMRLSGTVNSSDSFFGVRSPSKRIKIKIKNSSFLGLERSLKNNYEEICSTAFQHLATPITNKLFQQIIRGGSVEIGSLLLDSRGITARGLFGARTRVTWALHPEVRNTQSGFLWMSSVSGIIEISYFYPPTGKIIVIGKTTSRTENGCLVPNLIHMMNAKTGNA
jgi:hypothetical protein